MSCTTGGQQRWVGWVCPAQERVTTVCHPVIACQLIPLQRWGTNISLSMKSTRLPATGRAQHNSRHLTQRGEHQFNTWVLLSGVFLQCAILGWYVSPMHCYTYSYCMHASVARLATCLWPTGTPQSLSSPSWTP
jgi:hypothetical protein